MKFILARAMIFTIGCAFSTAGLATAVLVPGAYAQGASDSGAPLREVRGRTIISKELPTAEFTFGKSFRYVGGQRVNSMGTRMPSSICL